jgi:hypothetical protein
MNRIYIVNGIVLTLILFLAGSLSLAQLIIKLPMASGIHSSLCLVAGFVYGQICIQFFLKWIDIR